MEENDNGAFGMFAETGLYGVTGMSAGLTTATPLPNEHPFYAEIGRVAANWARLEHVLDQIIWTLAKTESAALSCLTGSMIGPGPRMRAIRALCELRELPAEMAQRIKKMDPQETSLKRNRIVHDAWFAQSDGAGKEKIGQFKSQTYKGPNLGFVEITAGEINEILGYIQSHINDALQILSDIP